MPIQVCRRDVTIARLLCSLACSVAVAASTTVPVHGQIAGPPEERRLAADARPEGVRDALVKAMLDKWEGWVEVTYGADVRTWRQRLAARLQGADLANLQVAVSANSYEEAMATLLGRSTPAPARPAGAVVARLGDLLADLTYTPVPPCRIVDTRVTGSAIAAGGTANFVAVNVSNYSVQGGSATGCAGARISGSIASSSISRSAEPAACDNSPQTSLNCPRPVAANIANSRN